MRRRVDRFMAIGLLFASSTFIAPSRASAQRAGTSPAHGTIVPEPILWGGPGSAAAGPGSISGVRYSVAAAASASVDSIRAYRRSYWLEGGVIGALWLGLGAVRMIGGLSASGLSAADQARALLFGASVGFPVGALIGGLVPKCGCR